MGKKYLINQIQLQLLSEQTENGTKNLNKYSCLPDLFRLPTDDLIKKGYNLTLLKASLGIISRESDFTQSRRYNILGPIKNLLSSLGINASVGPGQIKPTTAKSLGLNMDEIKTAFGALEAVYRILSNNYSLAIKNGYTASPSSNLTNGTGNSALDIAIMGFNTGSPKITKYCQTSNKNISKSCALAGKTVEIESNKKIPSNAYTPLSAQQYPLKTKNEITVYNKELKNYIPNYKTQRADGVNISTHGYISEVAKTMKGLTCF
jgi:hypothetical protein